MSELSRFGELEAEVAILKVKEKVRQYATPLFIVSGLIIFVTMLGLLGPMIPCVGYKLTVLAILLNGLLLGVAFLGLLAVGIGFADILQHILPSNMKGGDIETTKALKVAGTIIGSILAMLLVVYCWNVESNPILYIIVIALMLIGTFTWYAWSLPKAALVILLLFFIPIRNVTIERTQPAPETAKGNGMILGWTLLQEIETQYELGFGNYPSKPAKKIVLEVAQNYGDYHAAEDSKEAMPTDFADAIKYVDRVGDHGNKAETIKSYGLAKNDGRIVPTGRSQESPATYWMWHDTGYEIFAGQTIVCWGQVYNDLYLSKSGTQIPIGCQGLSKPNHLDDLYTPITESCATGSFTVQIVDRSGMEHVFCAGSKFQAPLSGHLFTRMNGPYRYKESLHKHPELFRNDQAGSFSFRLESATINTTEENPTPKSAPQAQHKSVYKHKRVSP